MNKKPLEYVNLRQLGVIASASGWLTITTVIFVFASLVTLLGTIFITLGKMLSNAVVELTSSIPPIFNRRSAGYETISRFIQWMRSTCNDFLDL